MRWRELLPDDADLAPYLRVIDLARLPGNRRLNVFMDGGEELAVGYLAEGDWQDATAQQSTLSSF